MADEVLVLLVDDEEGNVDSLKASMKTETKFPIKFFEALNESEAKRIIDDSMIDVVVTDLVMTGEQGGLEVLRAAKEKDPLTMVILLTAFEDKLDRYKAYELGAFDCVPKNAAGLNLGQETLVKVKGAAEFRALAQKQIEYERTKASICKYFDPKVFNFVEKNPDLLKPQNRMATIAFWDIRGFSALSESLKAYPHLVTGFLEEYFELITSSVFKYNGLLDKFIGDGAMAIFGVTETQQSDEQVISFATSALLAALEIRPRFETLVAKWRDQWGLYTAQDIQIGLGCGIHTGEALVGRIGTSLRDQFTAFGTSVNFASRLCSRAKSTEVLVSTSTQLRCKSKFVFEDAGVLNDIKNIQGTYPVFNVIKLNEPQYKI